MADPWRKPRGTVTSAGTVPGTGGECQAQLVPDVPDLGRPGGRPGQSGPRALRSRHPLVNDGEVVTARFVRPRAGWGSRHAIRLAGGRSEAGPDGWQAKASENPLDDRRPLDHGEDLHRAPAARTDQRIHLVDLANQPRPRSADLQGCPIVPGGDWARCLGFREELVALAVASRPIGVPAIEEGFLPPSMGLFMFWEIW